MANATRRLLTRKIGPDGIFFQCPVKTDVTIVGGNMVAQTLDEPIRLVPGSTPGSGNCVGFAHDNSLATDDSDVPDGLRETRVETYCCYAWETVSGPDAVTLDTVPIGAYVYMVDDHTVSRNPTYGGVDLQIAGIFMGIDIDGPSRLAAVMIKPDIPLQEDDDTDE